MNGERRLVQIFRSFVERVFLPQLKATDRQVVEWGKFNSLLAPEPLNYEELQAYVDSFQTGPSFSPFEKREQLPLFKKKTAELDAPASEGGSFNPSKTFGGERARMMFPLKNDMDDFSEQKPQFGSYNNFALRSEDPKKNAPLNPQLILPGLERLCKTFVENQQRIDNMLNAVSFSPGKYH